ncbi:MAG: hypothetical protein M1816_002134 [Peltula sp. TS41687]|nr:MAG: hypothetical protein M1816_002134 [Peltula sp. TS41687]
MSFSREYLLTLVMMIMLTFTSMTSAFPVTALMDNVSVNGLLGSNSTNFIMANVSAPLARGLNEFDHSSKSTMHGRVAYLSVALSVFGLLVWCLAKRSADLSVAKIRQMKLLKLLVLLVYLFGMCYIISGTLLQVGVGLNTVARCRGAIYLCLIFYVGCKIFIYIFLVERAHSISPLKKRLEDKVWLVSMAIIITGFGTIAILAFLHAKGEVSTKDGQCRIGLPLKITFPLLIFDIIINIGMTVVFYTLICPSMKKGGLLRALPAGLRRALKEVQDTFNEVQGNSKEKQTTESPVEGAKDQGGNLERLALKSFVACIAILITTTINLGLLIRFEGRELAWLCLLLCCLDIGWSVVIIHFLTADPVKPQSVPSSDNTSPERPGSTLSLVTAEEMFRGSKDGKR